MSKVKERNAAITAACSKANNNEGQAYYPVCPLSYASGFVGSASAARTGPNSPLLDLHEILNRSLA